MQQLLAITRKEFYLWVKKPGSWILVFVIPFLFIWIIQTVFGSTGNPVVTIYAVNEDKGRDAARVMSALKEADHLEIEEIQTREEADRRVGRGERMAALIVPKDFSQALKTTRGAQIQLIIDPARSDQANIVTGLVNASLAPMLIDAEVSRGVEAGISDVLKAIEPTSTPTPAPTEPAGTSTPEAPIPAPIPEDDSQVKKFFTAAIKGVVSSQVQDALDNPQVQLSVQASEVDAAVRQPSLLDHLVPGFSLMFVFFLISNLAVTVIEERQTGTLRRLLVAPIPRSRILLGKMLPYFLISVVQMTLVFGLSKLAFGIDLGHSLLGLGVIIAASSLAMASLGILVASLAQTEGQADGLGIVLVLAMAVISGSMFPSIFIPGLQYVTPHYWAMQGFLNIIARAGGVETVLRPAGVLLTMAAVFFTIGAIRFRFE